MKFLTSRPVLILVQALFVLGLLVACDPGDDGATPDLNDADSGSDQDALSESGVTVTMPTHTPVLTETAVPTDAPTPEPSDTPSADLTPVPSPTDPVQEEDNLSEPNLTTTMPMLFVYTQLTDTGAEIFGADWSYDPPREFQLTETSGAAFNPFWSPNMRYIAYLLYDPTTDLLDIWLIDNAAGAETYPVSVDGVDPIGDLSWFFDNQFLIFAAPQPDGSEMDIYRLDIETSEIVNLTADSPVWDAHPTCSPIGDQIVFVSDRAEMGKFADRIWMMAADGSDLQAVSTSSPDGFWEESMPSWSPDGEEIAFFRWAMFEDDEHPPLGLIVADIRENEERVVYESSGFSMVDEAAVWSPDGSQLGFLFGEPFEKDVYVVSAAGGEPVNVSELPGDEISISWSPDSQYLSFTNSDDKMVENAQIFVASPDGSYLEPLIDVQGNSLGQWSAHSSLSADQ